jgi:hypothetical protein
MEHNAEIFFHKWQKNERNDPVRAELLDKIITKNSFKNACLKRKQDFLLCIHQALDSNTPLLYEKGIILLSEMIDIDFVNKS